MFKPWEPSFLLWHKEPMCKCYKYNLLSPDFSSLCMNSTVKALRERELSCFSKYAGQCAASFREPGSSTCSELWTLLTLRLWYKKHHRHHQSCSRTTIWYPSNLSSGKGRVRKYDRPQRNQGILNQWIVTKFSKRQCRMCSKMPWKLT